MPLTQAQHYILPLNSLQGPGYRISLNRKGCNQIHSCDELSGKGGRKGLTRPQPLAAELKVLFTALSLPTACILVHYWCILRCGHFLACSHHWTVSPKGTFHSHSQWQQQSSPAQGHFQNHLPIRTRFSSSITEYCFNHTLLFLITI